MRKKLSSLIALSLSMSLFLSGCGAGSSSETTKPAAPAATSGTFKIGLEAGYAPFNWTQMKDTNGGVKIDGNAEYAGGYDVEIAKGH